MLIQRCVKYLKIFFMAILGFLLLLAFIFYVVPRDMVWQKLNDIRARRKLPISLSPLIHFLFFFLD